MKSIPTLLIKLTSIVSAALSRWKAYLTSYVKEQPLEKNVLLCGDESFGSVSHVIKRSDPYLHCAKYRPYKDAVFYFVGFTTKENQPDWIGYRFYDPVLKKEFILSEELTRLILYREIPVVVEKTEH